jgi:predicted MFS family arabinose efflux permease
VQGAGAAVIASASLALVGTTFPEGRPRDRAMAVYAAMSVSGAVIGLVAGGLLTTYASWRWVLFVNVPAGALAALAAPRVLGESARRRGRLDLPGAVTGTAGVTALVYGLSSAAVGQSGASHWGDASVVATLAAATVLLAAFAVIQARSRHGLLPVHLLADRNRTGAYLVTLCLGTALLGMFFFLTLFMQVIWGYSALKTGLAYLPEAAAGLAGSGAAAQLLPRVGARRLLLASSLTAAGGLIWLSRLGEHSTYASGLLGPMLITGAALGIVFVPLSLTALSGAGEDSGAASSLLNAGQQVGGAAGLAVLGTIAWTVAANRTRAGAAHAATAAARAGHHAQPHELPMTAIYHHALAAGFARGLLVAAAIMLLAAAIAAAAIRTRREHPIDLASSHPVPAPDDQAAIPARRTPGGSTARAPQVRGGEQAAKTPGTRCPASPSRYRYRNSFQGGNHARTDEEPGNGPGRDAAGPGPVQGHLPGRGGPGHAGTGAPAGQPDQRMQRLRRLRRQGRPQGR